MARRKSLWQQHLVVWGQSAKTGRKYRVMTRSDKYAKALFDGSTKCAIVFNNSMCISLGNHKGTPREEIEKEWESIKKFWDKMKAPRNPQPQESSA